MGQSGVKLARGGIVLGGELVPRAWLVSLALALSCLPDIAPQPPDPLAPAAACVASEDCGLQAACGGPSCVDGRCQLDNEVAGTPCDEDGGRLCNGAGHCVECTLDNDCAVAEVCTQQRCAPTLCTNGAQDGTETDVDCGGDDCPRCANGLGCFDGGDCVSLACEGNVCVPSCSDGLANQGESDVDCGGPCPGCEAGKSCLSDTDCEGGSCDPMSMTCLESCSDGNLSPALGESDIDCGGSCPGCALGLTCVQPSDCASGSCQLGSCVPAATCSDGMLNGGESDMDCGGPLCAGCSDGKSCGAGSDCQSKSCDMGLCVAPTCSDSIANGGEIDVDCGPVCSVACPAGAHCLQPSDCLSGVCQADSCAAPSCFDGVQNGGEPYIDCGGPCVQKCWASFPCYVNADCVGNECHPQMLTCTPNCFDGWLNNGETDPDCGGPCAVKCPVNGHCSVNTDCVSNNCDSTGHCVS
jgi:hypothetical protein